MKILQPKSWPKPKGYSNGIEAQGSLIFVAGQIAWNESEKIVSSDLVAQVKQVLLNIVTVLAEAKARPEHIVRLTWFVKDKREYLGSAKEIGVVYRSVMGSHYPTMSLVEVKDLLEDQAKVEIEATAVVPGRLVQDREELRGS